MQGSRQNANPTTRTKHQDCPGVHQVGSTPPRRPCKQEQDITRLEPGQRHSSEAVPEHGVPPGGPHGNFQFQEGSSVLLSTSGRRSAGDRRIHEGLGQVQSLLHLSSTPHGRVSTPGTPALFSSPLGEWELYGFQRYSSWQFNLRRDFRSHGTPWWTWRSSAALPSTTREA